MAPKIGWMLDHAADETSLLIGRIAEGDRQALADLYARYQRMLFSYLLQLTPDAGLAEEILQDTFVAVWNSAARFEGKSSVSTWLIGIARRQAHNTLRQHTLPLVNESELETMVATEPEPEDVLLARATRDELVKAFQRLAPLHREVLVLVFIHEFSQQEVAKILSVPVGTVKSRLSNARKALRALLDTEEGTQR